MTLQAYYSAKPKHSAPRFELLKAISARCGVSIQTARNWCIYGIKPRSYEQVKVLMEITGLTEHEMWNTNK